MDMSNSQSSEPGTKVVKISMVGTGASAPTKVYGQGVTITRTGAGVYVCTLTEAPGKYAMVSGHAIAATTPANVKNHSIVFGLYSATTKSITVNFFDASAVAHDLAAAEWISFDLVFKDITV